MTEYIVGGIAGVFAVVVGGYLIYTAREIKKEVRERERQRERQRRPDVDGGGPPLP